MDNTRNFVCCQHILKLLPISDVEADERQPFAINIVEQALRPLTGGFATSGNNRGAGVCEQLSHSLHPNTTAAASDQYAGRFSQVNNSPQAQTPTGFICGQTGR